MIVKLQEEEYDVIVKAVTQYKNIVHDIIVHDLAELNVRNFVKK